MELVGGSMAPKTDFGTLVEYKGREE